MPGADVAYVSCIIHEKETISNMEWSQNSCTGSGKTCNHASFRSSISAYAYTPTILLGLNKILFIHPNHKLNK